jgi:prolyl-tRNA editing enzyme YbaK/EbsC (Cys-tRNA(Pro) deacylase)
MNKKASLAPGCRMKPRWLTAPVVSCIAAAAARGIPLENELKTAILHTSDGPYAVHVPGDSRVSLRAVKSFLSVQEAFLMSPLELYASNLAPGTICAVLEPVWSMRHLISLRVLKLNYVTTNNGTLNGYFIFSPDRLLEAVNIQIGNFEDT